MKIVLSFVFQMNHHFFYRSFKRQKAANLHKTSGVCNIIFVILTCFHATIFFGEEKFSWLASKGKLAAEIN